MRFFATWILLHSMLTPESTPSSAYRPQPGSLFPALQSGNSGWGHRRPFCRRAFRCRQTPPNFQSLFMACCWVASSPSACLSPAVPPPSGLLTKLLPAGFPTPCPLFYCFLKEKFIGFRIVRLNLDGRNFARTQGSRNLWLRLITVPKMFLLHRGLAPWCQGLHRLITQFLNTVTSALR